MATKLPRGVRNNNPGNLDYTPANKWQGQIGIETDVPPGIKPRFAKFKAMEYGVRALAVLCINYYDKNGCDTLMKFFSRYAPPSENNTQAYASAIARDLTIATGSAVSVHDLIDLHDFCTLRSIVCGIIEHENGVTLYSTLVPEAQLNKGLTLAGVEPPKKPLAQTSTMKNATVIGVTGISAVASGVAKVFTDNSDHIAAAVPIVTEAAGAVEDHGAGLFIIFGIIVMCCAAYMAWNRYVDRKEGVR